MIAETIWETIIQKKELIFKPHVALKGNFLCACFYEMQIYYMRVFVVFYKKIILLPVNLVFVCKD